MGILADVLGFSLHRTQQQDATTLGAALLAGMATGCFEDLKSASESMVKPGDTFATDRPNHALYNRIYRTVYEPTRQATASLPRI